MSVKRLSTDERLSLVRLAQERGASFAARVHDVNRKTAYHWLLKFRNDGISDSISLKIISVSEKNEIIKFAKENGVSGIKEFSKKYKLRYSFSSIYKILASSKIPVGSPRILSFSCSGCSERIEALYLYIGKPTAPLCSVCGEELKLMRSRKIYFLGSIDNYLLAHDGELKRVTREDVSFIQKSLKPPDSYFPKYVDFFDKDDNMVTHIVGETSVDGLNSLCGAFPYKRRDMIYSSFSGSLNIDKVCSVCVDEANDLFAKGIKLEPKFKFVRREKRDDINDAIALAEITKNISQACRVYKVSRSSYYAHSNKKKSSQEKLMVDQPFKKTLHLVETHAERVIKRIA